MHGAVDALQHHALAAWVGGCRIALPGEAAEHVSALHAMALLTCCLSTYKRHRLRCTQRRAPVLRAAAAVKQACLSAHVAVANLQNQSGSSSTCWQWPFTGKLWHACICSSHTCQGTDSGLASAISKNPSEGSSGANQGVGGDNVFSKSDCFVLQRLLDNRMARGYNLRGTSLQGKQTKKERRARKNLPVRKKGPS